MSRIALNMLLTVLGKLLARASRVHPEFRKALTRDRTIAVTAGDVAHTYTVHDRTITASRGRPPEADCTLSFAATGQALETFMSVNRVGKIVEGALNGTVQLDGNLMLLLWFEGRIQQVLPVSKRGPARFDGAYAAPRDDIKAASQITREPAVDALDPGWTAAWEQRKKLAMPRVAGGEPHKDF